MTPADRTVLNTAAGLISEDAQATLESCAGNGGKSWACGDCKPVRDGKCKAQLDHEARVQVHVKLLSMARRA